MAREIVYQPAWVRCVGPEHHHFATQEDVKQLALYVSPGNVFAGLTVPNESLVSVRCPKCRYQVEAVTDERGFAVTPP
jgi:hypothetical protein